LLIDCREALTAPQVEGAPVDGDVAKDFLAKLAFCPSTDRGIDYEARDWRNRTRLTLYGEWAEFCMWVIDHQGRLLSALTHPSPDRGELVEALNLIDALDPEGQVYSCSADALRGLVLRMGEIARAALAKEGK
jgi:hypothetical protein